MATSPPAAYPGHLPNTKKRPSISSQASLSGLSAKRPKLHPLRQTSFPVTADGVAAYSGAPARSETGSVIGSTFSATSKAQPRSRGRPKKSLQIAEDDVQAVRDGHSQGNRNAGGVKSVISTRSGAIEEDPGSDEEEEDVLGNDDDDDDHRDAADRRQEEERMNTFIRALDEDQREKYTAYRASKFKKNIVRRIVNQTVGQSVNVATIEAVQFFSKAFAIEIIERAREVQAEYSEAYEQTRKREGQHRRDKLLQKEAELTRKEREAQAKDSKLADTERRKLLKEITRLKTTCDEYIPNKHAGGLLPDHLREAVRRYKADGEGGGFGFDSLSHPLLAAQGSMAWKVGDGSTGIRLFR